MFSLLKFLVVTVISYAAFGAGVWALIDASRRSNSAFTNASKQSKTLWIVILAIATALLFVALPLPFSSGQLSIFDIVGLAAAVAVVIYHVGVKPALGPHRRGPSGGGRSNRNTGGW
jgi:1,4-dihydroxy-2-naphthoate octaprenyltransferase